MSTIHRVGNQRQPTYSRRCASLCGASLLTSPVSERAQRNGEAKKRRRTTDIAGGVWRSRRSSVRPHRGAVKWFWIYIFSFSTLTRGTRCPPVAQNVHALSRLPRPRGLLLLARRLLRRRRSLRRRRRRHAAFFVSGVAAASSIADGAGVAHGGVDVRVARPTASPASRRQGTVSRPDHAERPADGTLDGRFPSVRPAASEATAAAAAATAARIVSAAAADPAASTCRARRRRRRRRRRVRGGGGGRGRRRRRRRRARRRAARAAATGCGSRSMTLGHGYANGWRG